jgi:hypothetical protein
MVIPMNEEERRSIIDKIAEINFEIQTKFAVTIETIIETIDGTELAEDLQDNLNDLLSIGNEMDADVLKHLGV